MTFEDIDQIRIWLPEWIERGKIRHVVAADFSVRTAHIVEEACPTVKVWTGHAFEADVLAKITDAKKTAAIIIPHILMGMDDPLSYLRKNLKMYRHVYVLDHIERYRHGDRELGPGDQQRFSLPGEEAVAPRKIRLGSLECLSKWHVYRPHDKRPARSFIALFEKQSSM